MKIFAGKRDYNLDYFVGKDAWVKVLRSWDITPVYMRVLRAEASHVGYTSYVVNWVDADDVDNSENAYGDWSDQRIIDFILEETPYFDFNDCNIVEPLQVLSTDEIISIILENNRCGREDSDYSDGFVEDDYNEDL